MKMLQKLTATVVLVTLLGSSASADDPVTFDYLAYTQSIPNVGGTLKHYGLIQNNGEVPTPIPMTFGSNIQHTIVIEGTLLSRIIGAVISETYSPTTVKIYTDNGPATLADFANPAATFQDGTLILSGTATLTRSDFPGPTASYSASINWTGGTRVGELAGNSTSWILFGGGNTSAGSLPAGYVECLDGEINQPVVAVDEKAWGAIKDLYR